ncbi:GlyGly-CTERM sorting domain-containing protein [Salmonella enterica]|nr:hypothetical protein [Salmonella enterica]EDZ5956658.1 GlyGly-CTERM sorting domain-containing protein [Salmonella enterica]HAE8324570.1 GlyGly-CTERM sorting domain-containing protein [Salmonella enterica subsp. houtenae serovar 50:g,z51:-]
MLTILNGIWWIMMLPILLVRRRQPGHLLPFLQVRAVKKLNSFTELRRQRGRRTVHSCLKLSY